MKHLTTLAMALLITACGSGGGGGGSASSGSTGGTGGGTPETPSTPWISYSVSTSADLPTCAGDIIGRLYYVETPGEFQVCKSTGWTAINLSPSGKFAAGIGCSGTISGLTGAAGTALNGLIVYYQAVVTNYGDVMATGSVATGGIQVGATSFYSVTQVGSLTGPVLFNADFATANGGFWTISTNRTTLVVTAVYTDSSLGSESPVTMNFSPSACSAMTF